MLCPVCDSITLPGLMLKGGFRHHSTLADLSESARQGCEFCALLQDSVWGENGDISPGNIKKNDLTMSLIDKREIWAHIKARIDRDEILCKGPLILRLKGADRIKPQQILPEKVKEVEILLEDFYKDETSSYRFQSNFELFADFDSPFDLVFKGRPLKPSSLQSLTLASTWLEACIQSHHSCGRPTPQPLPTRLIDVGSLENGENPFLLESTGGQLGNWFALSYCWGKALPFKTENKNLKEHMRGIPLEQLPAVFRDAVQITRRLECRYLWIDALCIIQDSPDDWRTEATRMHSIYSNATLTIIADAAIDPTYGIFASGDSRRHNFDRTVALSCTTSDTGRNMKARLPLPPGMGSTSPVNKRGWALQEDLLSPRVLRYSAEQVFWACQELRCCEAAPETDDWEQDQHFRRFGTKNSFFDKNLGDTEDDTYFRFWNEIVVNNFTRRSLSKQTDTMFAVAGLAREIQRHTDSNYIAGLWLKDLPAGLLWRACRCGKRLSGKENYIAPSWSWASMTFHTPDEDSRPPTYQFLKHLEETAYESEVIAAAIMPSSAEDIYGQIEFGFLVIAGNWRYVDDFKEFPTPFYDDWNNTRSMWDKESRQSDLLLPNQIVCNLDEGTTCAVGDELNIFGQGNVYLQILPDVLGIIHALILAPAEPIEGNKAYRRIGIAQIPKDDGMADDWESEVFVIV